MTKTTDLIERDREVLAELVSAYDQHRRIYERHMTAEQLAKLGVKPMDCGGSNGSDHSYRLTKLAKAGLAEHRKTGWDWGQAPTRYRGSKLYRPTDAGRKALAENR